MVSVTERPEQSVPDAQEPIQNLVARCLDGDESAWRAFVDRHSRLVYSIPRRYGFDRETSEDIFQDVFLAAYRALDSIKDAQSIPKWLITTAVRASSRAARAAKKTEGQLFGDQPIRMDEHESDRLIRIQELRTAMERLGGRCEKLLTALYCCKQNPNYDRVADELGIPRGSIGPTRKRCLEKLANLIKDEQD